jgi:hypothetical protein
MPRLRVIEILGGPLDGRRVPLDPDNECLAYTDGLYVYQHFIDYVYTGNGVKKVLRHVATVPMPRREGT